MSNNTCCVLLLMKLDTDQRKSVLYDIIGFPLLFFYPTAMERSRVSILCYATADILFIKVSLALFSLEHQRNWSALRGGGLEKKKNHRKVNTSTSLIRRAESFRPQITLTLFLFSKVLSAFKAHTWKAREAVLTKASMRMQIVPLMDKKMGLSGDDGGEKQT